MVSSGRLLSGHMLVYIVSDQKGGNVPSLYLAEDTPCLAFHSSTFEVASVRIKSIAENQLGVAGGGRGRSEHSCGLLLLGGGNSRDVSAVASVQADVADFVWPLKHGMWWLRPEPSWGREGTGPGCAGMFKGFRTASGQRCCRLLHQVLSQAMCLHFYFAIIIFISLAVF